MKNQNNKILADGWFNKAHDDQLSCEDILNDRHGAPNTVCFLSQQLAEKCLKGFLVYQAKEFPKIHQLDRLIKLCGEIDTGFEEIKDEAEFLTGFYVTTRYPGDYPEFFWTDAEKAFKASCKIKEFVLAKIDPNSDLAHKRYDDIIADSDASNGLITAKDAEKEFLTS